jgi:hypothetical protein
MTTLYIRHHSPFKGLIITHSPINTRQGDQLGGPLFILAHVWTFHNSIDIFLSYLFPFVIDDTHIIGHASIVQYVFNCLVSQLDLVGFITCLVQACLLVYPFLLIFTPFQIASIFWVFLLVLPIPSPCPFSRRL